MSSVKYPFSREISSKITLNHYKSQQNNIYNCCFNFYFFLWNECFLCGCLQRLLVVIATLYEYLIYLNFQLKEKFYDFTYTFFYTRNVKQIKPKCEISDL